MRFKPQMVIMIIFGLAFSVSASELPRIQFSIKPNLCILSNGEEYCHDELHLQWQSKEKLSLCLYQSNNTLALRCWENKLSGEYDIPISTDDNIEFELRDAGAQRLLVAELFEVVHDDAKFRRRRRNPWSFF